MLHEIWTVLGSRSTPEFTFNIGTLLSGIAAMVAAIGSGVGVYLRYHKETRQIARTESDAALVKEASDRVAEQYEARIRQYEAMISTEQRAFEEQQHFYEERLTNLQALNTTLLGQILKLPK